MFIWFCVWCVCDYFVFFLVLFFCFIDFVFGCLGLFVSFFVIMGEFDFFYLFVIGFSFLFF